VYGTRERKYWVKLKQLGSEKREKLGCRGQISLEGKTILFGIGGSTHWGYHQFFSKKEDINSFGTSRRAAQERRETTLRMEDKRDDNGNLKEANCWGKKELRGRNRGLFTKKGSPKSH